MKDEIKELLINSGMMSAGIYVKLQFTKEKYKATQIIAFVIFGSMLVWIVHLTGIKPVYQSGICLVGGVWISNIAKALIKAGDKSEDKAADKISKKIEENL